MVFLIETFTHSSQTVQLELNYYMKLTGARIVSFKQVYEETGLHLGVNIKKYL